MARIRTVKPEYFQHEGIWAAEEKSGLPLRIAYIGLWTQADKRGCFRWRPRELKLNILPYDPGDFSIVLDALEAHGFLVRYQIDGFTYGWIPTLGKHQLFNMKERVNQGIPNVPEELQCRYQHRVGTVSTPTQHSVEGVLHVGIGSGPGSEGKGREGVRSSEQQPDAPTRLAALGGVSSAQERKAEAFREHQDRVVNILTPPKSAAQ